MAAMRQPSEEVRRLHLVVYGAGLSVNELAILFGKSTSIAYRILNGTQGLTGDQMNDLAKAAAGKGEWKGWKSKDVLAYLGGHLLLGPDTGEANLYSTQPPSDLGFRDLAAA